VQSFENLFVSFRHHFLGSAGQQSFRRARVVPAEGHLPDANESLAEVCIDQNKHPEVVVHFALPESHVQLELAAVGRGNLIFEVVLRHLRSIHAFVCNDRLYGIIVGQRLAGHFNVRLLQRLC
jgi:hypothetical protein